MSNPLDNPAFYAAYNGGLIICFAFFIGLIYAQIQGYFNPNKDRGE